MISNCGHDENGKYHGGKSGDQTGTEWTIIPFYKRPWNFVARYPDESIRKVIASDAEKAANNNNIGYDQDNRISFWNELVKANYKVDAIKTKCEADCSSGVAAIVKGIGIKKKIKKLTDVSESMTTFNSRTMLRKAGFEILTASKYLNSDNYLMPGDILVNDNHHMAINLSTGAKVEKIQNEPKQDLKSIDEIAKEVIAGKWGNDPERSKKLKAAGYDAAAVQKRVNEMLKPKTDKYKVKVNTFLNVRSGPGTTYSVVGKLSNNDIVEVQSINSGWAKIGDKKYVSSNYIVKV